MFITNGNELRIDNRIIRFRYPIRTTIEYKDSCIVLVGIPFEDSETINNIVCYNSDGEIVWQVEDMKKRYPDWGKYAYQPYETMGLSNGVLYASTFNGWSYHIDPETGRFLGYHFVK